jgi:hypothetical protein
MPTAAFGHGYSDLENEQKNENVRLLNVGNCHGQHSL